MERRTWVIGAMAGGIGMAEDALANRSVNGSPAPGAFSVNAYENYGGEATGKKPPVKALAFDVYGTLFDVHSVASFCEEIFPGHGAALSQLWRTKQLEYSWLLSLMGRYEDFWQFTKSALLFACETLASPPTSLCSTD